MLVCAWNICLYLIKYIFFMFLLKLFYLIFIHAHNVFWSNPPHFFPSSSKDHCLNRLFMCLKFSLMYSLTINHVFLCMWFDKFVEHIQLYSHHHGSVSEESCYLRASFFLSMWVPRGSLLWYWGQEGTSHMKIRDTELNRVHALYS